MAKSRTFGPFRCTGPLHNSGGASKNCPHRCNRRPDETLSYCKPIPVILRCGSEVLGAIGLLGWALPIERWPFRTTETSFGFGSVDTTST